MEKVIRGNKFSRNIWIRSIRENKFSLKVSFKYSILSLGKSDSSPKKSPHKKAKTSYKIPEDSLGLIKKDVKNKKIWNEIIEVQDSHQVRNKINVLLLWSTQFQIAGCCDSQDLLRFSFYLITQ